MNDKVAALLIEMHRLIEEAATDSAAALRNHHVDPWYPPNGGLTADEAAAIRELQISPTLESALRKLIASAAASAIFHTLSCLDGVADPENYEGDWFGLALCEPPEDHPEDMLHDEFCESYWTWRDLRPDPGWRLDNYVG